MNVINEVILGTLHSFIYFSTYNTSPYLSIHLFYRCIYPSIWLSTIFKDL